MLWFIPNTLASLFLAINLSWLLHVSFVAVAESKHLLIECLNIPKEHQYNLLILIFQGLLNLSLRILRLLRLTFIMKIFTFRQRNF